MYSADPVQPRPNPIPGCSPTPRPTPYLWTGLGWTNFRGSISGRAPTHPLCVVDPPNHAATRVVRAATEALPQAVHTRRRPKTRRPMLIHPAVLPVPKGRQAPTRGESRLAMKDERFGRSPDETDAARHSYAKGTVLLGADVDQGCEIARR